MTHKKQTKNQNRRNDMNYKELAKTIITNVGGEENIQSLTHCATRLR
ncbi:hypothetical protein B1O40_17250, partial [Listeria monocytogenes]|nr:hypothetical protein [Listeria monocytogenes]